MSISSRLTTSFAKRCLPRSRFTASGAGGVSDARSIYLTFDDGPDEKTTPLVLEQLNRSGIKATFFVIGENAAKNPNLLKRMFMDGHSIGTHSWSHYSVEEVSNKVWLDDVSKARHQVEDILGTDCSLFRAPYGHYNPLVLPRLLLNGYRIIHWNADTRDYDMVVDTALVKWFEEQSWSTSNIVLMHDNHSPASRCLFDALGGIETKTEFNTIPMKGFYHQEA